MRILYKVLLRNRFLQFVVPFFAISGLFFVVTPESWYPEWFFPRLTGLGGMIYATVLLGSNLVFPIDRNSDLLTLERKHRSLTRLQNYFAISLLLTYGGTLGLYHWAPYDMIAHFAFPFLAMIALSRFIYRWWDIPLRTAIIRTILIVAGASLLWELTEYTSDHLLGTNSFGDEGGRNAFKDTAIDSSLDAAGIILGFILVKIRKKPWPY